MYDDARLADFEEGGVLEGVSDQAEVGLEQGEQVVVGNVAGGDHEESAWQVLQQVAIAEVAVLVTTTRFSLSATSASWRSPVRLPSGRPEVWILS